MCVLLSSTNRTSRASLINYLPAQTSYFKKVELLMEFYIVDNSNKVLIVFGVKKKSRRKRSVTEEVLMES